MKQKPPSRSPAQPAAQIANVDCHFGRIGTGNEIGRAEQIKKLLGCQPLAADDDFIVHERNVRGRSAKSREAKLEEEPGNFC